LDRYGRPAGQRTKTIQRHAKVECHQADAGFGDSRNAAMVGGECVSDFPRSWTINDLKSIDAQALEGDAVGVVPCLDEEHDIDPQVAPDFKQVIELIRQ